MSSTHTPQEKKRLSYSRDHYNRNGENNKSWRKAKPLKKRKAVRAFRKASNDLTKVVAGGAAPKNAEKRLGSIRKKKILDWGSIHLSEFVATRKAQLAKRAGKPKRGETEANRRPHPTIL
ncbi:MAG: hypothetical protein IPL39_23920 [Opitutaceae bacterium]|nr:hypothetical protein [Opitutaceae bacterium]